MTDRVTYLGHATVLLEIAKQRIITDPVLTDRVAFIRSDAGAGAALSSQPDVVLVSHGHQDHLHRASLRAISADVPMVVPAGSARWSSDGGSRASRSSRCTRRRPSAKSRSPPCQPSTPASGPVGPACRGDRLHRGGRGPKRVLRRRHRSLPGDGRDRRGGLDLALLPVWGWGPRLGPGHLDPDRAAEAVALLRPAVAIPIHWGTLWPITMRWRRHQLTSHRGGWPMR